MTALKIVNLSLLILFPIAWFAPLMRAGLLPLFGLSEISVMTGLTSLWGSDIFLAIIVAVFAVLVPMFKTVALALVHWNILTTRITPLLGSLGKLAMADVFLIALYITLAKGVGVGRIETAWGLYLFTACILASLWVSWKTEQSLKKPAIDSAPETTT